MVIIGENSVPIRGKGQKFLAVLIIIVMLLMSTVMFFRIDKLKYYNDTAFVETAIIVQEKKNYIDIAKIAERKISEDSSGYEIIGWNFNEDSLKKDIIDRKCMLDIVKGKSLEDIAKKYINLEYNQYKLVLDNGVTFYFKTDDEAQEYKKKFDSVNTKSVVENTTVAKGQESSKSDIDKEYENKYKSTIAVAKAKVATNAKATTKTTISRSSGDRTYVDSGYKGILPIVSYHYISSPYRPSNRPNHTGVDFAADCGTHILAFKSGTVIKASWSGGYGNCIEVSHGNGLVTRYAHCSGYNVSVGDYVGQGDTIGFVGMTGNATGYHLHFEIIINGVFYNPVNYIK